MRSPGCADRATVLRNGHEIGTVRLADVSRAEVVQMIVGRSVAATKRQAQREGGAVRVAAEDLNAGVLRRFCFEARAGEIVGLTGLAGSGAGDLGGALIGQSPSTMVASSSKAAHSPRGPRRLPIGPGWRCSR